MTESILDSIPGTDDEEEEDEDQDGVPDSTAEEEEEEEEESDLDTPKPLTNKSRQQPPPQLLQQQQHQRQDTQYNRNGSLRPAKQVMAVSDQSELEATRSKYGHLVYQVKSTSTVPANYFTCQWRKPQFKKVKTWDGDAYLRVEGSKITFIDDDGKAVHTTTLNGDMLQPGQELKIGGKEVEVDNAITVEEFKKATNILNKNSPITQTTIYAPKQFATPFKRPAQIHAPRPVGGPLPRVEVSSRSLDNSAEAGPSKSALHLPLPEAGSSKPKAIPAETFYGAGKPTPIKEKMSKERAKYGGAPFDPNAEGAVVMDKPNAAMLKQRGMTEAYNVVVDPYLSARMRDHQKEGVKFMYRCVMGMTEASANGCILADEMGLGKTLQTIALIQTLLRQSPYSTEKAEIGKALIVCPVSLIANWKKEFKKWLGSRLIVNAYDGRPGTISHFINNPHQQILIIGYEKLRKVIDQLASCVPQIGLIVCDEGHRLKSKDNKTTKMFTALSTPRRIILSGTPVQNDLGEYWAMVDFCCPGLLGTSKAFAKKYEEPIRKSREPGCKAAAYELGRERAQELTALSKEFVLRRMANVLQNYLPPKYEYVLFIAPTKLQLDVYTAILGAKNVAGLLRGGSGGASLGMIDVLRKISNSPMLLRKKDKDDSMENTDVQQTIEDALKVIPKGVHSRDVTMSGKLYALDKLLHRLYADSDEKIVLISNWTATLDILANLCKSRSYNYLRLDGSTSQKSRQENVDRFNREKKKDSFVFLLSAKAGGVGLNLIGASRLVLFDSDWNPSTDLQAMARIHRDGQKRPVFLYRFLTTNTIDEKVYQRQLTKTGLSEQMMDQNQSKQDTKDSFSMEELRAIFTLDTATNGCQTHDLLGCDCCDPAAKQARLDWERQSDITDLRGKIDGIETDDDSDDEEAKGFVQASQYDPAPTQKQLKKAAQDQQDKLRSLKKWQHIDAFDDMSFRNIKDTILYNHFMADWASAVAGEAPNVDDPASSPHSWADDLNDNDEDEDMTSANASAIGCDEVKVETKRGLQAMIDEVVGNPSSDEEVDRDGVPESDLDGDKSSSDDDADDDGKPILPRKRKSRSSTASTSTSTKNKQSKSTSVKGSGRGQALASKDSKSKKKIRTSGAGMGIKKEKRYDLRKLAESGMGGRVMFVFEKVSASKL